MHVLHRQDDQSGAKFQAYIFFILLFANTLKLMVWIALPRRKIRIESEFICFDINILMDLILYFKPEQKLIK